ncbi:unnamed protein product [Cyprideis torosa]|uniref:Uncharacterized protein n=1 Tax=Cyprideis torosa TaxID=163714 RepID=A0A7R8W6Z9_9CRUS|nr:unnamed protein product [Cyprideis torosa]CAG0881856.1 unnamed protein product [Cyprideis torosa]
MGSLLTVNRPSKQILVLGAACAIAIVYAMRKKDAVGGVSEDVPKVWRKVAEVSGLYVYPVRSGHAISVERAECTKHGIKTGPYRDRAFMLLNQRGERISSKKYPSLVLLNLRLNDTSLTLRFKDKQDLTIDMNECKDRKRFELYGAMFDARCLGPVVSEWLTESFIPPDERGEQTLFLVYHDQPTNQRLMKTSHFQDLLQPTDNPLFASEAPYLLCSEASLSDLQQRIKRNQDANVSDFQQRIKRNQDANESEPEVQALDFRPNILIRQAEHAPNLLPFAEDDWRWIKLGKDENDESGVILRKAGDCPRHVAKCAITAVSHEHGVKRRSLEPMMSLKMYRQHPDPETNRWFKYQPRFGAFFAAESQGFVSVGNFVYVGVR